MAYVDLVTGEIRYQLNPCSCGKTPKMITFPNAAGGTFYGVVCNNCRKYTPTLYRTAAEAEDVWNEMVRREKHGTDSNA